MRTVKTNRFWWDALAILGISLNVVVLSGVLLFAVAGCVSTFTHRVPRPPRGKYTLQQAQRYVQRMNSTEVRNQGYRQVKR